MKLSRGKKHNYLWTEIDFTNEGLMNVDMVEYIKTALDDHEFHIRGWVNLD